MNILHCSYYHTRHSDFDIIYVNASLFTCTHMDKYTHELHDSLSNYHKYAQTHACVLLRVYVCVRKMTASVVLNHGTAKENFSHFDFLMQLCFFSIYSLWKEMKNVQFNSSRPSLLFFSVIPKLKLCDR